MGTPHSAESQTKEVLAGFFAALALAPCSALLLDYDGTLAPFRRDRGQAFPYPGVRDLLARLQRAESNRLVIVSGRSIADLVALLGLKTTPELWGSHGWERQRPGRPCEVAAPPARVAAVLQQAWAWLQEQGLEDQAEQKSASVALHWRGLPQNRARRLEAAAWRAWRIWGAQDGLELLGFAAGLELRASGRDKGHAVRTVLDEMGAQVCAAYLGDDATDEDAFQAIAGRGLGIRVSGDARATAAQVRLRPPGELLAFLASWAQVTGV